jgi:hypothetical protein
MKLSCGTRVQICPYVRILGDVPMANTVFPPPPEFFSSHRHRFLPRRNIFSPPFYYFRFFVFSELTLSFRAVEFQFPCYFVCCNMQHVVSCARITYKPHDYAFSHPIVLLENTLSLPLRAVEFPCSSVFCNLQHVVSGSCRCMNYMS